MRTSTIAVLMAPVLFAASAAVRAADVTVLAARLEKPPPGTLDAAMTRLATLLDVPRADLPPPARLGVEIVLRRAADGAHPAYVARGDWGSATERVWTAIESAARRAVAAGRGEERATSGPPAFAIAVPRPAADAPPPPPPDLPFGLGDALDVPAIVAGLADVVHVSRDGERIVFASDGAGGPAQLAELEALAARIGPADASLVIAMPAMRELIEIGDPIGIVPAFVPPLVETFGRVDGVAVGARWTGGATGARIAVTIPEGVKGVSALMSGAPREERLPPFAGSPPIAYARLRGDLRAMPEALGPLAPMLAQLAAPAGGEGAAGEFFRRLFGALGPRVEIVVAPVAEGAAPPLVAIECAQPDDAERILAVLGPRFGIEARARGAHVLHVIDPKGFGLDGTAWPGIEEAQPFAAGAGGYLLVGTEAAVNAALDRLDAAPADAAGAPTALAAAIARLGAKEPVAWGWADLDLALHAAGPGLPEVVRAWLDALDPPREGGGRGACAWEITRETDGFVVNVVLAPAPG
jgi:hypothetical protein